MLKYISNNTLNLAVLAQIAGIAMMIMATPTWLFLGAVAFAWGTIAYRKELKIVRSAQASTRQSSDA